jgi:hypothetical protein
MAQGFWMTLNTLQAAGTAITAAARTSMTVGSTQARFTLPGNLLKNLGDQIRIYATGIISTVITTPGTARFDVAMGTSLGTAIMDTTAMPLVTAAARTNVPWILDILGTLTTTGTAAVLTWTGVWLSEDMVATNLQATGPGPGGTLVPYSGTATGASTASAAFDATVSNLLDLNFTQTAATGSCQLKQMNISILTATGF